MSEYVVYRSAFLNGAWRATLTWCDRGASIKWEPHEPRDLGEADRDTFEHDYHAWRDECAADYQRRIGRTLADDD